MYEVRTRDVPEQWVVVEQRDVDQAELVKWLPGAMSRVAKAAEEFGGMAGTPSWPYLARGDFPDEPVFITIYGGNPNEGPVSVEACAPVLADAPPAEALRRLPAHREAYVRVTKETVESGQLGPVYGVVEEWIGAQGLEIADAPREVYWTDFFGAAPTDEVFDAAFPIK